jgi:transaldolase
VTSLKELFEVGGQSPWLDNVRRDWLRDGTMARLVDEGIRGVTSNPTIFEKAIAGTDQYDEQLAGLGDVTFEDAFVAVAEDDITATAKLLAPVHDSSEGEDGYVSFEVAPTLAHDTPATVAAAKAISARFDLPNLFVKVPATPEGIPAITALIAQGISVNVTLIFGPTRYVQVVDAYLDGLEQALGAGRTLSSISSVASFFVSRVDTEVDARLGALGADPALKGTAAVAQAVLAYETFNATFGAGRFAALEQAGARRQRPLWASTSTKNPAYSDLLYVDSLIGPSTVNTMPGETIEAFLDHGVVARTLDEDVEGARRALAAIEGAGVSMEDVAKVLEDKGVSAFAASYHELLQTIEAKRARP